MGWVGAPAHGMNGLLVVRPEARGATTVDLLDSLGGLTIYGETPPKLVYGPRGILYAAYLVTRVVPGQRWPQSALRLAVSRDDGYHWAPPITVSGSAIGGTGFGSYDDHALAVGPDGTLYLSWLAMAGDLSHTYVASSSDNGATWSTPTVVDAGPSCPCCRTAMAPGRDNTLYVAWRKRYVDAARGTEIRDIVVARSDDHGRSWTAPVRVHADDWQVNYCPDAGPSIRVAPSGVLHIAWWTGKPGHAGVQYARSVDRGATFSTAVPLGVAALSRPAHVQLALGTTADSALVLAVWDDGTRRVPAVVARVSRDGGQTFGETQVVSAPDRVVGYPVVLLRGDTARIAWQERSTLDARQDSIARAGKDPKDAATYINTVGAMRIVAREGLVR